MNLQLDEVSAAVEGALSGPGAILARGYSIDSRTMKAGDLFFAVKGPRFDGHDFLRQAVDRKACGIVIDAAFPTAPVPNSELFVWRLQWKRSGCWQGASGGVGANRLLESPAVPGRRRPRK